MPLVLRTATHRLSRERVCVCVTMCVRSCCLSQPRNPHLAHVLLNARRSCTASRPASSSPPCPRSSRCALLARPPSPSSASTTLSRLISRRAPLAGGSGQRSDDPLGAKPLSLAAHSHTAARLVMSPALWEERGEARESMEFVVVVVRTNSTRGGARAPPSPSTPPGASSCSAAGGRALARLTARAESRRQRVCRR